MPQATRILITGCARSGNTLLSHLMATGFADVRLRCEGPNGEQLPPAGPAGETQVSRFPLLVGVANARLGAIEELGVLATIRDPRDVLTSLHDRDPSGYWVGPDRWIKVAREIAELVKHPRVLLVRFEELLIWPDVVQRQIAATFGLTITRPFVDCPPHFDASDVGGVQAMHGIRPLDARRVGAWRRDWAKRQYLASLFKSNAGLRRWSAFWNYGEGVN